MHSVAQAHLSAEELAAKIVKRENEDVVLSSIHDAALYDISDRIKILNTAMACSYTKIVALFITATLQDENDHACLEVFSEVYEYAELSSAELTTFISRYHQLIALNSVYQYKNIDMFIKGLTLPDDDVIAEINIIKKNKYTLQRDARNLQCGILRSERFALSEKAFLLLAVDKNDTDNHAFPKPYDYWEQRSAAWDLVQKFENDTSFSNVPERSRNIIFPHTGIKQLNIDIAEAVTFLNYNKPALGKCIDSLSEMLKEALDQKDPGLSKKLMINFPKPTSQVLTNGRLYPKIDQLNPNNVKLKKHSILKNILFDYLRENGLFRPDAVAPDKYLFFIKENQISTSGIYEEAMLTLFTHGKLSHLIQMFCLVFAIKNGTLQLNTLDAKTLLESFIFLVNGEGRLLWDDAIDRTDPNGTGFRSPENVFEHLLDLDNCLGSYMRASLDGQLKRVTALYHSLLLVHSAKEISPTLLFHFAALSDNGFFDAITPSCNGVLNLTVEYYKQKNYSLKLAGPYPSYIVETKPKQKNSLI